MVSNTFVSALISLLPLVSAVPYIHIDGANFVVNGTGDRFDIIGVDYQPGGSSGFSSTADPLSDAAACLRDAILMQQLGINTIRVYNVDNDINHDQCASIFNAAGIYMILDVNSGLTGQYIDRTDPASTYTESYLEHIFGVIEAFANYPNLLGFWAANEIINEDSSSDAPAYIRAVVRDMKEYIANNIGRSVPVGYSAADVSDLLSNTWDYLSCSLSNSTYSKIDFFGLNDYEWCGDSTFTESGYNDLVSIFGEASIPVFFSEYGCNLVEPRTFTEVAALYSSEMTVLSGGLVYEWTEETNDYGLIDVNSSTEITLLEDYNYLKLQLADITESVITAVNASAESITATSCNTAAITGTATAFPSNFDLPSQPSGAASLISSGGLTSVSTGSLVSVTATTMAATVYNYTDTTVTGLKLVELACNVYNSPGLVSTYTSSSASCAYSTASPTGGSSSSSTSSSSGSSSSSSSSKSGASSSMMIRRTEGGVMGWMSGMMVTVVGAVLATAIYL